MPRKPKLSTSEALAPIPGRPRASTDSQAGTPGHNPAKKRPIKNPLCKERFYVLPQALSQQDLAIPTGSQYHDTLHYYTGVFISYWKNTACDHVPVRCKNYCSVRHLS